MADEDKKAQLLEWLQIAAELELATIPPYLTALLSIQLPASREAAALIRSVMIEEMLHLTLVANVMSSVGGGVRLGKANVPSYPLTMTFHGKPFADRRFAVDLAPFRRKVIQTFMKIEEPAWLADRPKGFTLDIEIPGITIGAFYQKIESLLEELNAETQGAIFSGNPTHQIREDYYWSSGGKIIAVTDLATAKAALNTVIAQGEASWRPEPDTLTGHFTEPLEMGHYFRFSEIFHEQHYARGDDPAASPTGSPLIVDYHAVSPFKVNARSSDYPNGSMLAKANHAFNSRYTAMLRQLEESFNGTPRSLYTAIILGMHTLAPLTIEMMKTAIDGDPHGRTGCPTFEWLDEA